MSKTPERCTLDMLMYTSEIRQVPDNQEVYLDKDGFSSIVVDILERVERPDDEALKFHLQDIVEVDVGETKVWTSGAAHFSKLPYVRPLIGQTTSHLDRFTVKAHQPTPSSPHRHRDPNSEAGPTSPTLLAFCSR